MNKVKFTIEIPAYITVVTVHKCDECKLMTKMLITEKVILDACCGSRMFWFDKKNPNVEFCDNRVVEHHEYYPNRYIEIKPDTVCDFTALPFPDKIFKLVVFDPPHLKQVGKKSWLALKYGTLDNNWDKMIHDGFAECMRVLDDYGVLIFKWSEVQIPLSKVLDAIGKEHKPLFGHRSGKNMNTHWMAFMKGVGGDAEKGKGIADKGRLSDCPLKLADVDVLEKKPN